jgi:hypothetical protein
VVGCGTLPTTVPTGRVTVASEADGGGGVVSVTGGGGEGVVSVVVVVVGTVAVVEPSPGEVGVLDACVLGSWVDSVVTSVTGASGALESVVGSGVLVVGLVVVAVGVALAIVVGGLVGTASFAFLAR